jgi:hypothetical protein
MRGFDAKSPLPPFAKGGKRGCTWRCRPYLIGMMGLLASPALLAAAISDTDKYAWAENAGWLNFKSTNNSAAVQVYTDHLEGYVWAENAGWIRLSGTAQNAATYRVNRSGSTLSGYAWSENAGWINFAPTGGGVTLSATSGQFDGYAWSENLGWLHLRSTTAPTYGVAVQQTAPGAPAITGVTAGDGQLTVAFTAPADDGFSAITSYTVTCTSSDGGLAGSNSGTSTSITVSGLSNGKTYTCTVKATNAIAAGDPSGASPSTDTSACGPGISLTVSPTALWDMLALPCEPTTATVQGALGKNTTGNLDHTIYNNAPANGWVMSRYNVATNVYDRLAKTDALSTGVGYWLKSFKLPVGDGNLKTDGTATAANDANGCASSYGCKAIPITTKAGLNYYYNLVGNPFPYAIDWSQVRIHINSSPTTYTPDQAAGYGAGAASPAVLSNQIWLLNSSKTGHDTFNPTTPGMVGQLRYFRAFWIKVLPGAYGKTIELLIPALPVTGQIPAPASDRLAGGSPPRSFGWLDWLIAPAAAEELAPDRDPAVSPDDDGTQSLAAAPNPAAAPIQPVKDPAFGQWVAADQRLGLSAAEAIRAAHAKALGMGREWYVRLKVDDPATGFRDHNNVFGQLLTARDGYDPDDLVEMAPYAKPYLTLVFPHQDWKATPGDYASDFRAARASKPGITQGRNPASWTFVIRAEPLGAQVILSWEGKAEVLKRSRLIDQTTGETLQPSAAAWANGYPVDLRKGPRTFIWRYLGDTGSLR